MFIPYFSQYGAIMAGDNEGSNNMNISPRSILAEALEHAQEAVRIDTEGSNSRKAIEAYARSIGLLRTCMEKTESKNYSATIQEIERVSSIVSI